MLKQAHLSASPGAEGDVAPPVRARAMRALARRPLGLAGAIISLIFVTIAIIGPVLAPHDPSAIYYSAVLTPPSHEYPFGTDATGRDVLSRVLAGARISLTVSLVAVSIATGFGTALGIVAGYVGGWIGGLIMRVMDVMLAFPDILLAIVIITIIGPGLTTVMIAVGIAAVPAYTRTVRSAVLNVREQDYVEAARALGASAVHIMAVHVLRNVLTPILVLITVSVGLAILAAAGLSFIGLGAPPPTPEWGDMLNDAQNYMQQTWWMAVFPGAAIMLVVVGLNLLGDGLREVLDPTIR